jgi:acyl-coenzyme A thioesterase PaaI-like protein
MTTTDSVLREGLAGHGDHLRLTLDPRFQGLPGAAHGGSVLAAFHAVAGLVGRQAVHGLYRKRVPLGTPLGLSLARRDGGLACRLFDETDTVLVEGGVTAAEATADIGADGTSVAVPGGDPLPISSTCFACGIDNPLGLRVRLSFDDTTVGGVWQPRETVAMADGSLAPIALTSLLDEAAFWLGALASGESGMTTDLAITLHGPVAFGTPITITGARARTRQRPDDERYWDTEIAASDATGRVGASARITFVAVRGAARRLVTGILSMNAPEIVRRVFPAYTR